MLKRVPVLLLIAALLVAAVAGCGEADSPLDRNNPQLLTFCHSYGGGAADALEELIADFNGSVGRKSGIAVRAIAVEADERDELLRQILSGEEGAPTMPDLIAVSPGMGHALQQAGRIAALDGRFADDKLESFVTEFLEAGRLADNALYLLPIAQTTEVLFVNKGLLQPFAEATGAAPEDLASFEGLSEAAIAYYQWSEAQDADGGAALFGADSWLRLTAAGVEQLGGALRPRQDALESNEFQRVWQDTVVTALMGGYTASAPQRLIKAGELVCYTGPATDIGMYSNYQLASLEVLPYPVYGDGVPIAPLLGDSVAVASATEEAEYAAARFLDWLTEPKQNTRLVTGTGFLPVTEKALEDYTKAVPKDVTDETARQALETVAGMYASYEWVQPLREGDDSRAAGTMEDSLRWAMTFGRRQVADGESVPALHARLALEFAANSGDLSAAAREDAQGAQDTDAQEPVGEQLVDGEENIGEAPVDGEGSGGEEPADGEEPDGSEEGAAEAPGDSEETDDSEED